MSKVLSSASVLRFVRTWRTLALVLTAAFLLFGMVIQNFTSEPQVYHTQIKADGFINAALDDLIIVGASCPGKVAIRSGYTTVAILRLAPGRDSVWHVLGDDQYEIRSTSECVKNVAVSHRIGSINPLWTGLCFLFAAVSACWFALLFAGPRRERETDFIPFLPAAVAFVVSVGVYLAVPPYFHNDEVGGNLLRNWGYRGWGYLDTVRDIAYELWHGGIYGLTQVQSFSKPIVLPMLGMLTGFGAPPYTVGIFQSAILMGLACAGLVIVAYWAYGRLGAIVAGALFTFNPIVLAYSTSFYQECGWLCGVFWAAIFAHRALKEGSRVWMLFSVLTAAFAISSKHLLIAPLTIAVICAILLFLRHSPKHTAYYAAGCGVAATMLSVFAWPFLWEDSGFRIPFVLGARVTFDNVHGFTEPLYVRAFNAFWNGFQRITPVELVFMVAAAYLWFRQRGNAAVWLFAGLACVVAFTLPTSFFLQHYVLYGVPFLALIGGLAAVELARRTNGMAIFIATLVFQGGWSALYYPYTGMAGIVCVTPACSIERLGVDEPVYGLREAAAWLKQNASTSDVVVSLAAPHVLQAYLDKQQVLFMPALPEAATPQHRVLELLRARYVVRTVWSREHLPALIDPSFTLAYSTSDRLGGIQIYARRGKELQGAALPDLSPADIETLGQTPNAPVQFFGDGAAVRTISSISNLIQISTLPPAPQLTLNDIGAGTIIAPSETTLSAELSALYGSVGQLGRDRYSVYRIPAQNTAVAIVRSIMERTKYNTMKAVATLPQRYASEVTAYRLSLQLPLREQSKFPRYASAGCVFGRSTRVPVIQTSGTTATAIFPVADRVLQDCANHNMAVFIETSSLQSKEPPLGIVFATSDRSG